MQMEAVISTLLAAAAFLKRPFGDVATQAIKDGYEALKAHLRRQLEAKPEAVDVLELATVKPDSLVRRALLAEECAGCGWEKDPELQALACQLAARLPLTPAPVAPNLRIMGTGNRVQVAGRDLVTTTKHVMRNEITPDERHLTVEQSEELKAVMGELALRIAGKGGRPNFAGAHRMLQRRFKVASYLLVPREEFAAAIAFLKQQRAAHRSGLLPCNPAAYRNDFYRAIYSAARELRWEGGRVYEFATAALGLKKPVASLKQLGLVQLRKLASAMRAQSKASRVVDQAP